MATITTIVLFILLPVLILATLIDRATMSPAERIRHLHRRGWSQTRIASTLNLSRYKVRKALA